MSNTDQRNQRAMTEPKGQFRVEVPKNCLPYKNQYNRKEQVDENALRSSGAMNIDLWARGELYPIDPITRRPPNFHSASGLIHFACKGNEGLLGYCNNISSNSDLQLRTMYTQLCGVHYNTVAHCNYLQHCTNVLNNRSKLADDLQASNQKLLLEVDSLKRGLKRSSEDIGKLEMKMKRLKRTPFGMRERRKDLKALNVLAPGGGGSRRRITAIKKLVDPSMAQKKKRKPCNSANLLKNLVTKDDVIDMLKLPGANHLRKAVVDHLLAELGKSTSADSMQELCDNVGISRQAYIALFRCLQEGIKQQGITKTILPRLSYVRASRSKRNAQVHEHLGEMYQITTSVNLGSLATGKSRKKGGSGNDLFVLNEKNNCWMDLSKMLLLLVRFYDLKVEECAGKLQIAIKLDEMELIKGEKYERVSLTLMNRALSNSDNKEGKFSVQSEDHIWWIGIFQVPEENHGVLQWVFQQTHIPTIIAAHGIGEKLHVPGYGDYEVEWHLAADLKTIKCMYNMKHGSGKTTHACPYCLYARVDEKGNGMSTLECDQDAEPTREKEDDTLIPVLAIPVSRVHVCTLHAFLRIVDKMVYMSILFAWNKSPQSAREKCMKDVEKVLSDLGLHGGDYKILQDSKRGGKVPCKPSMGGVKAKRFLPCTKLRKNGSLPSGKWEGYKDLLVAEDDRTSRGRAKLKKIKAWQNLSSLVNLMAEKKMVGEKLDEFKASVTEFTKSFIQAWGECNVTHYIHILHAHGLWFAKQYGSLGIWNTQGMEKSHKQAKNAFFRFTQHRGSYGNSLQQMCQWFYRRIMCKLDKKDKAKQETELAKVLRRKVQREKKKQIWCSSSAAENLRQWRSKRIRQGRRYTTSVSDVCVSDV